MAWSVGRDTDDVQFLRREHLLPIVVSGDTGPLPEAFPASGITAAASHQLDLGELQRTTRMVKAS